MCRIGYRILLLSITASSCATLRPADINLPDRVAFEPLKLYPAVEPNNLRIDLVRQTRSTGPDSASTTEPVDYHPIGFDLGNGLFMDSNNNLSLRVDYLLGIEDNDSFKVRRIDKPHLGRRSVTYVFRNDSLQLEMQPRSKVKTLYHRTVTGDSTAYLRRTRLQYAVVSSDSALYLKNKKRVRDLILQTGDGQYVRGVKRKKDHFSQRRDTLYIDNDYTITLSDNDRVLSVRKMKKRKSQRVCTLVRNAEMIVVFDRRNSGKRIYTDNGTLIVYTNSKHRADYELARIR